MRVRRQISLTIGALLGMQLLTSFAAIGLLSRMGPAIEGILEINGEAIASVDEMILVLAEAEGGPVAPFGRVRYAQALARVDAAVDDPAERPAIERLQVDSPDALDGERGARVRVLAALERVGRGNVASMQAQDADARALGLAGAWAAAALGLGGLGLGVLVRRRLARDVEAPLAEVDAALTASRGGDPHRRAGIRPDRPLELARIAQGVNDLLDRRQPEATRRALRMATADRAVVLYLLDREPRGMVVIDGAGELMAANQAANELLSGPGGQRLRAALLNVPSGGRPDGWNLEKVGSVWLCTRREDASRYPDSAK
jgi:hypothetical protein